MSMLGFTFSFGARDDGMKAGLASGKRGVEGISTAMEQLNSLISNARLSNLLHTFESLRLDEIENTIKSVTGEVGNLQTGLESQFISMEQTAAPALAQLGLAQDEYNKKLRESTSLAYSMNVGVEQVQKTQIALHRTLKGTIDVFSEMGLGLKELVKLEGVTGIETDELAASVTNLTSSYGFSTKRASKFLDVFTDLAQRTGTADTAFSSLKTVLGELDEALVSDTRFARMTQSQQQDFVESSILEVQRLAVAFKALGKTPQEAQEAALTFFKSMLSERKSINDLEIGLGDFGEVFKNLAREAGVSGVDKLIFSSDPTKAIKQLFELRKGLKGDALARFNKTLNDILPGFGFLKDAGNGLTEALDKIPKASKTATGSLKKMGDQGFKTGLTLDDMFSRIQDGFETKLINLGAISRSSFLSVQKEIFGEAINDIKKLGSDETFGPFVSRLVSATKIGNAAFFLPIQRSSKQTSEAIAQIGGALGDDRLGLTARFKSFLQLGIGGFFIDLEKFTIDSEGAMREAEQTGLKYYRMLEETKALLTPLVPALIGLAGAFTAIYLIGGKLVSIVGALVGGFGALFRAGIGLLNLTVAPLIKGFGQMAVVIMSSVITAIKSLVFAHVALGKAMFLSSVNAVKFVSSLAVGPMFGFLGFLGKVGKVLQLVTFGLLTVSQTVIGKFVPAFLLGGVGAVKGFIFSLGGAVARLGIFATAISVSVVKIFGPIVAGLATIASSVVASVGVMIAGILKGALVFASAFAVPLLVIGAITAAVIGFKLLITSLPEAIQSKIGSFANKIGGFFDGLSESLASFDVKSIAQSISSSILGLFTSVGSSADEGIGLAKNSMIASIGGMFSSIGSTLYSFGHLIFKVSSEVVVNLIEGIKSVDFGALFSFLESKMLDIGNIILDSAGGVLEYGGILFENLISTISNVDWGFVGSTLLSYLVVAFSRALEIGSRLFNFLTDSLNGIDFFKIGDYIGSLIGSAITYAFSLIGSVFSGEGGGFFEKVGAYLFDFGKLMISGFRGAFGLVIGIIKGMFTKLGRALVSLINDYILGPLGSLLTYIQDKYNAVASKLSNSLKLNIVAKDSFKIELAPEVDMKTSKEDERKIERSIDESLKKSTEVTVKPTLSPVRPVIPKRINAPQVPKRTLVPAKQEAIEKPKVESKTQLSSELGKAGASNDKLLLINQGMSDLMRQNNAINQQMLILMENKTKKRTMIAPFLEIKQ